MQKPILHAMKKNAPIQATMYSPDLFLPESRINVFGIKSGNWVGYITEHPKGKFTAQKVSSQQLEFSDIERAKAWLRNEVLPMMVFDQEEEEPKENPNQTSLFD
jgi:hypothetical protein